MSTFFFLESNNVIAFVLPSSVLNNNTIEFTVEWIGAIFLSTKRIFNNNTFAEVMDGWSIQTLSAKP
jgi:hypothetical protein